MPHAVLVVDDDREIASIITDLLAEEGYATTAAFDGQQALDRLDREEIDLLVSDIRMPRLDGIGLVHRLRERGWEKPIVLMSAVEAPHLGGDGVVFLRKPVDLDTLIDVIQQLLGSAGS